jgi:mxaJ protein
MRLAWPLLLACAMACSAQAPAAQRVLRVCADPNNLPFSNAAGDGFENRIVAVLARELGARVEYTWWAQRRGFLRNTLNAGTCDVVAGLASGMEAVRTTRPVYRSTYVFVTRATLAPPLSSLDDPRLASLKLGVQLVGDDGANTPPAHALARRGLVDNVRGFTVYGDYRDPAPQADIVDAVADGRIDAALVWGPVAGYFARRAKVPLALQPVTPWLDGPRSPMVFDVSLGVRKDDAALRLELDRALERQRAAIDAILADYGVPRVAP